MAVPFNVTVTAAGFVLSITKASLPAVPVITSSVPTIPAFRTVTGNVDVPVLPATSSAEYVTVVVPGRKCEPLTGLNAVLNTPLKASVADPPV